MRKIVPKPSLYANVKIAEPLIEIMDNNLVKGKRLDLEGFKSRVDFVELAVLEKLKEYDLVSSSLTERIIGRRALTRKRKRSK
jgi:hypothetical protein